MSNKFLTLCLSLIILLAFSRCSNKISITNLKTEYQIEPIGIDVTNPRFSWQMKSDRYGAAQSAYQLIVATSEKNLRKKTYVFDTKKINSDNSLNIVYNGMDLKPATRYYWQVTVWDENGHKIKSDVSWFETGLLNSGWGNAQWIGSAYPPLSKYRTSFDIDYDVRVNNGSNDAVFVFGVRDSANYVMFDLHLVNGSPHVIICHFQDGNKYDDYDVNIAKIVSPKTFFVTHHINIHALPDGNANKYLLNISVDSVKISNETYIVDYSKTDIWKPYCRLYSIGFKQPIGQSAIFSHIVISEKSWNTVLYRNDNPITEHGMGMLHVWCPEEETGAPMLRKEIAFDKQISSARLYVTARGMYQFYINGKKLGYDFFNPGCSDFRHHIFYNTYDITSMLVKGKNAIGAVLGAGWYTDFAMGMPGLQDQYGVDESMLAKIVINFRDGSSDTIVTDNSWKCYDFGPILSNSLQNGEDYDARREVKNWNKTDYNDSLWYNAKIFSQLPDSVDIVYYIGSSVINEITLTAQSMTEPKKNVYVYDMGQNMVGIPRIFFKGKKGQMVTISYGEMLYPDNVPQELYNAGDSLIYAKMKGYVYNENYRTALCTDHYIFNGDVKGETYKPDFTYHGYRYLVIYGLTEPLPLNNIKGIVLESAGKQLSSYETSNNDINRLYSNIIWSQRGNFLSIPTDCPQRDERMGWSGDAQIFARSATYNMNVDQFYTRWLITLRDEQGQDGNYSNYIPKVGETAKNNIYGNGSMGWTEVGIILPWQIYQQYGDLRVIEQQYHSMTRYMKYLQNRSVNFVQTGGGFGDWLAIEPTNTALTNTAYYAYDALLMSKMANAIGNQEDVKYYTALYNNIKSSFNDLFVDAKGHVINSVNMVENKDVAPKMVSKETQTSYIVPLQVGLFNETNKKIALQCLVQNIEGHDNTLTTGFIGTPYINLVLSENGYDSLAYLLFEQTDYPSWLYPVKQGATTIWERWDSYTLKNGFNSVSMNSFNHYSYGSIEEWMMSYSIGIQIDENKPGYKHFFLQPKIGGTFTYIKGGFESMYGNIKSGWNLTSDGYTYNAEIPANTSATLLLEAKSLNKVKFTKGQNGIINSKYTNGLVVFELKSGNYTIRVVK